MKARLPLLFLLHALLVAPPARAAVAPDAFQTAENTFRYHDYPRAIALLEDFLNDPAAAGAGADADQRTKAREYLAASYWFERGSDPTYLARCREWFRALLFERPAHTLDAFYYPPEILSLFEEERQGLSRTGLLGNVRSSGGEPPPTTAPAAPVLLERRIVERRRNWGVCLVPFGVGQFYNGDTAKGVAFLTTEVVTLSTNIASYFLILSLREGSGRIAPQNMQRARDLRVVLYTSLGAYLALTVGGIVEALVRHRPVDTEVGEPRPVAPEGTSPAPPAGPAAGTLSRLPLLSVTPGASDDPWLLSYQARF